MYTVTVAGQATVLYIYGQTSCPGPHLADSIDKGINIVVNDVIQMPYGIHH